MKIDIHTHVLPRNLPDLKARYGYGGFVQLEHHRPGFARMVIDGRSFREVGSNCWDAQSRLADCDRDGVAMQVLSTVPVMFSYWAKPNDTMNLARFLNDGIAAMAGAHPDRFVGLGTLPMQEPALAIQELERCIKSLGFSGVQIGTNVNGTNLDAPEVFPILEAAADLGAAVFVHPWEMLGRERMPKYWLPWLVGMPAETALAICSLIFGGVLERLPRLRIAFAHGGGSFPGTLGRISHGFAARPDLCAVDNDVDPRAYLKRIYIDSAVHDPHILRFLVELLGADRIALGSDYPFPLGETTPGALIESSGFDAETRERLLWGTATEWLGLKRR